MRVEMERSVHIGPLPPADELAAIGQIIPNGAERVMAMAELDAAHVRLMQSRAMNFEFIERITARILSAVFAMGGLGGAVYLAMNGHDWVAGVIASTTIGAVVTALMFARGPSSTPSK
jgi:uncharacterized membrane protein